MKPRAVLASAVLVAAACAGVAIAGVHHGSAPPTLTTNQKVVICHATGSGKLVRIAPVVEGVLDVHANHPNDIIRPFDDELANGTTGSFPGLRVATAYATFRRKCVTTPGGGADLSVSKSVKPRVATVGDRVVFTIVGKNIGGATVRRAAIVDSFADRRLTVLSVATTQGRCRAVTFRRRPGIRCNALALAPGESFTVKVATRAVAAGRAVNHVVIISRFKDPTPKNNIASAAVVIHGRARPNPRPHSTG